MLDDPKADADPPSFHLATISESYKSPSFLLLNFLVVRPGVSPLVLVVDVALDGVAV